MTVRRPRRRPLALVAAVVLAALLSSTALAAPAAAHQTPSNLVRSGPNLTLVAASCPGPADNAVAEALAAHLRNAAKVCIDPSGLSPQTAALIAEFAPDRVVAVGGEAAVSPAVMDELTAAVRAAYRWAAIQRLGGATRVETAAVAARAALGPPRAGGEGTATLFIADGWNGSHVRAAAELVEATENSAVAFVSRSAVADGLPDATAALIADYRPERVIVVGRAGDEGPAVEAALEAALAGIGSQVLVERIAHTGEPRVWTPEAAPTDQAAREIFTAISNGDKAPRRVDRSEGDAPPFIALTKASGVRGVGSTLFTMRADGSDRVLRTADHNGWEWHPSDGRLAWADHERRLMAAAPDADGEVLIDTGVWPWWSPDGSRLMTWNTADTDGNGRLDSFEALLHDADGDMLRSLGRMDLRTWYYGDIPDVMWSRDGAWLAYVTAHTDPDTSEEVNELRIEPTDASAPPVTLAQDAIVLRWAPDGRHLLYATPGECGDAESRDIWDLWVASADGSETREIGPVDYARFAVLFINPWSPDGEHFAYEAVDPADCSTELRVSSVDGDGEPVAIAADADFLSWSPDSTHLEYGQKTDRPVTDYILPELSWIARRDGTSKRYIGEVSPSAYGWVFWSHDGTHISYTEMVRDGDGSVTGLVARTQRADGTGDITTLAASGNSLSWSDDGRVAYVAQFDDDGDGVPEREALRLHAPGSPDGDVELVHNLPAPTRVAIWSPDDSHLMFGSGSIESLIGWFRDRGRGVSVWGIETGHPRWMHRLITDVTWGEWQPEAG